MEKEKKIMADFANSLDQIIFPFQVRAKQKIYLNWLSKFTSSVLFHIKRNGYNGVYQFKYRAYYFDYNKEFAKVAIGEVKNNFMLAINTEIFNDHLLIDEHKEIMPLFFLWLTGRIKFSDISEMKLFSFSYSAQVPPTAYNKFIENAKIIAEQKKLESKSVLLKLKSSKDLRTKTL